MMLPSQTTRRPATAKMPGNVRPVPPVSLRDSADDLEVTAVDSRATASAVMKMSIPDDGPTETAATPPASPPNDSDIRALAGGRKSPPRPVSTKPLALRIAVPRALRQGSGASADNVTMELTLLDVLPGVVPPPLPKSASVPPARAADAEVEQVPLLFPKLSLLTIARLNLVSSMLTLAAVPFFLAYSMAAAFRWFVAATPRMKEIAAQALRGAKEIGVQACDRMRAEWARASRRMG